MSPVLPQFLNLFAPHLPSFHLLGRHDDNSGVLLPDHPPEVHDGIFEAALRGNVAFLLLAAVVHPLDILPRLNCKLVLL